MVPLSEEEQRILQEMEQKLREHDREFVDRVSHSAHRLQASRGAKWSAFGFLAGTVLLLATFRSSLALAICAVLVMVVSALSFAQHLGSEDRSGAAAEATGSPEAGDRPHPSTRPSARGTRTAVLSEEWSGMRKRLRSRFGRRD